MKKIFLALFFSFINSIQANTIEKPTWEEQLFINCMNDEGKSCKHYLSKSNCENICHCVKDKLIKEFPTEKQYTETDEDNLNYRLRRIQENCYMKVIGIHKNELKY
jgi:hypothetical protein